MTNIFKELSSFGYHDTTITQVKISGKTVKIYFKDGIYNLDSNGKESNLSDSVFAVINIDCSICQKASDAIEITAIKNKRVVSFDIDKERDCRLLKNLEVVDLYYSQFDSTIIIECGNEYFYFYIKISSCLSFGIKHAKPLSDN